MIESQMLGEHGQGTVALEYRHEDDASLIHLPLELPPQVEHAQHRQTHPHTSPTGTLTQHSQLPLGSSQGRQPLERLSPLALLAGPLGPSSA